MLEYKVSTKKCQCLEREENYIIINDGIRKITYHKFTGMVWSSKKEDLYCQRSYENTKECLFFDIVELTDLDLGMQQTLAVWLMGRNLSQPQKALDDKIKSLFEDVESQTDLISSLKTYEGFKNAEDKKSTLTMISGEMKALEDNLIGLKSQIKTLMRYHKKHNDVYLCDFYQNALLETENKLWGFGMPCLELKCMLVESEIESDNFQSLECNETGFKITDIKAHRKLTFSLKSLKAVGIDKSEKDPRFFLKWTYNNNLLGRNDLISDIKIGMRPNKDIIERLDLWCDMNLQ